MIALEPLPVDIGESLRSYWQKRLWQHHRDFYKGRHLMKLPEDLRTYQHVIEACRPEVILEFGTGFGASAIWFADQLQVLLGEGEVVTIGNHPIPPGDPLHDDFLADKRITFIEGDLLDEAVVKRVHDLCGHKRVMVCEDSGHTRMTTYGALSLYSDLVPKGSWFVVEDGIVDVPTLSIWDPTGVKPSIEKFLASEQGQRFVGHDLSIYGVSMHIDGWLEAIA